MDDDDGNDGRLLGSGYSINWVDKGKVSPVKSQGTCGACWIFSATTVMESMSAIKNYSDPFRLSEQQALDCIDG